MPCPDWYLKKTLSRKNEIKNLIGNNKNISEALINTISDETGESPEDARDFLNYFFREPNGVSLI